MLRPDLPADNRTWTNAQWNTYHDWVHAEATEQNAQFLQTLAPRPVELAPKWFIYALALVLPSLVVFIFNVVAARPAQPDMIVVRPGQCEPVAPEGSEPA